MKDTNLVNTNITYSLFKLLKTIRLQLEEQEKAKKRKRRKITKREVCKELVKRCLIKKVI